MTFKEPPTCCGCSEGPAAAGSLHRVRRFPYTHTHTFYYSCNYCNNFLVSWGYSHKTKDTQWINLGFQIKLNDAVFRGLTIQCHKLFHYVGAAQLHTQADWQTSLFAFMIRVGWEDWYHCQATVPSVRLSPVPHNMSPTVTLIFFWF